MMIQTLDKIDVSEAESLQCVAMTGEPFLHLPFLELEDQKSGQHMKPCAQF